jgi:imidazoleglycerol-phosphate dehydratase / histidinol-phosphatase
MKKVLFLDRDGTIIVEPEDLMVNSIEKLIFLPEVIYYLSKIVRETDYELVIITNQDGLGTPVFDENGFWEAQNKMMSILEGEGIHFADVFIDKSFAHEKLPTRKPGTGMLGKYLNGKYDLANSVVVGDRYTDIQLAKNIGGKGILIGRSKDTFDDDRLNLEALKDSTLAKVTSWKEIYEVLTNQGRTASIKRKTNETDVLVKLNLDGKGIFDISTGLNFFDHMLEQLSKHSGCDMEIKVKGDLHIDEHHTIEDTAIAIGQAFLKALGSKRGIERYGFLLPMDDCLAQAAIDFSGRPYLVWEAEFKREKVGDMPTELFKHFFKSFSDEAKCNLNIKAEGDNEHHKIEAIFKAVAKSIKMAVNKIDNELPSTKGVL